MTTPSPSEPTPPWVTAAVERCVAICWREVPRYARHLRRAQLCRDPLDDLLVLAARRQVPLERRVVRPLPGAMLPATARAFNTLDREDRRALLALLAPAVRTEGTATLAASAPAGPAAADGGAARPGARAGAGPRVALAAARGEHLASALARLVESTRARETRTAREARMADETRTGRAGRGKPDAPTSPRTRGAGRPRCAPGEEPRPPP